MTRILSREFIIGIFAGWLSLSLLTEFFVNNNCFQITHRLFSPTALTKSDVEVQVNATLPLIKNTNRSETNITKSLTQQDVLNDSEIFCIPDMMEAIHRERKATIKAGCLKYFPDEALFCKPKEQYIHENSLFSKKYKALVCEIFKCGSTSWIKTMFTLEGLIPKGNERKDPKIRLLSVKNKTLQSEIWRDFTKIITVRNPFSRLVSAYYNKMVPTGKGYTNYYRGRSQTINKKFRHLRHNETERKIEDDGNATFEDFVNYLLSRDNTKGDPHFLTYLSACQVCDAQYDYVIKMETFESDMEYLKQKLNLSEYHRKVVFPRGKYKINEEIMEKTFEPIQLKLSQKLFEIYHKDFEIFGYKKPEWLC